MFGPETHDMNCSLDDMIHASVEQNLGLEAQYFELQEHTKAWMEVTSNYSHNVIENLVRLYDWVEDQLELIDRIQKTLPREEIIKQDKFFKDLISRIKTGNFEPEDALTGLRIKREYHEPDEQQDLEYNMALYRASCEEEIDVVDGLKQERDSLKTQLADLEKSHDMEMARMEAKYKSEIEKIREQIQNIE